MCAQLMYVIVIIVISVTTYYSQKYYIHKQGGMINKVMYTVYGTTNCWLARSQADFKCDQTDTIK